MRFNIYVQADLAHLIRAPNVSRRVATILSRYREIVATADPQARFTPVEITRLIAVLRDELRPPATPIIGQLAKIFRARVVIVSGSNQIELEDMTLAVKLADLDPMQEIALLDIIERDRRP